MQTTLIYSGIIIIQLEHMLACKTGDVIAVLWDDLTADSCFTLFRLSKLEWLF